MYNNICAGLSEFDFFLIFNVYRLANATNTKRQIFAPRKTHSDNVPTDTPKGESQPLTTTDER